MSTSSHECIVYTAGLTLTTVLRMYIFWLTLTTVLCMYTAWLTLTTVPCESLYDRLYTKINITFKTIGAMKVLSRYEKQVINDRDEQARVMTL